MVSLFKLQPNAPTEGTLEYRGGVTIYTRLHPPVNRVNFLKHCNWQSLLVRDKGF